MPDMKFVLLLIYLYLYLYLYLIYLYILTQCADDLKPDMNVISLLILEKQRNLTCTCKFCTFWLRTMFWFHHDHYHDQNHDCDHDRNHDCDQQQQYHYHDSTCRDHLNHDKDDTLLAPFDALALFLHLNANSVWIFFQTEFHFSWQKTCFKLSFTFLGKKTWQYWLFSLALSVIQAHSEMWVKASYSFFSCPQTAQ